MFLCLQIGIEGEISIYYKAVYSTQGEALSVYSHKVQEWRVQDQNGPSAFQ